MSNIFTTKTGQKHNYTTRQLFFVKHEDNEVTQEHRVIKYQATATDEHDDGKLGGVLRRKFIVDVITIDDREVRAGFEARGLNEIWLS